MNFQKSLIVSLVVWLLTPIALVSAVTQKAMVINDQRIYREAKLDSKQLGRILPGEEAQVMTREGQLWQVALSGDRQGWTLANGLVLLDDNAHAAALLFDAAEQMSRDDSPEAWHSAAALFRKAALLKSDGPYAAEAQWRAAELSWRYELRTTAAVKTTLGELNALVQTYPKTPQAARAAFLLLRANLCEFWDGTPGCPEAEIGAISHYLEQYPGSEYEAESRYAVAYRHAALVEIYLQQDKPHFNAENAVAHKTKTRDAVAALLQVKQDGSAVWAARGERLLWDLENNIGVFSNVEVPLRR